MKRILAGGVTTVVWFLIFGSTPAVYAQKEQREQEAKPAQERQQQAKPAQEHQQQQARPAQEHQEQQVKPAQQQQRAEQPKPQAKPAQQQQRAEQKEPQAKPAQQQRAEQQKPQAKPAQQQQRAEHQQPQAKPTQQQQRAQQQQPQGNYQVPQRTQQEARSWQQKRGWQQQGSWQAHSSWQQDRSSNWQSDHRTWAQRGGYGGYYIPEDRFGLYFGSSHWFRFGGAPTIVEGYPRFQHDGFWFMLVDPWPEAWPVNWYATDDVYVGYNDGYYLYNRRDPSVAIALTVVL